MSITFTAPAYPSTLPADCHRLWWVGAGAWFHIEKTTDSQQFRIRRYSPTGEEECDRIFQVKPAKTLDLDQPFSFTYVSHCARCTIIQWAQEIILDWIQ